MPLVNYEDPFDASSLNNDSYQNNKVLQNIIKHSNMTTKRKAPMLFSSVTSKPHSPAGSIHRNQKAKRRQNTMQNSEDGSDNDCQMARDWVNQDLPVYPKTSKFSEIGRYNGMDGQIDSMSKNVFRTLEVSDEIESGCGKTYTRTKSEDRQEKKRKKSKKKKYEKYKQDAHWIRKSRVFDQEYYKEGKDQRSLLNRYPVETEIHPKEMTQKYSYDRALSWDVKSEKDENEMFRNRRGSNTKATYYEAIKSQVNDCIKSKTKKRQVIENYSSNRGNMKTLNWVDEKSASRVSSSNYEEYWNRKKSPTNSKNNPLFAGLNNSKASREYQENNSKTQKGLFAKNDRITSTKLYFQNFGESLNKQSLDYSRSTIGDRDIKSSTMVPHTQKHHQDSHYDHKKYFFTQAMQRKS